ncbi:MAG: electron transfer flavoprotein subunit alpha/FixB family protein, partial [Flavobacteriaceae bacterium]|nr:electron transfer flavoprotein subunit alpha/FixB family protein [Flavobacteriaceae bacterium]
KVAFEAVSYAKGIAQQTDQKVVAIAVNADLPETLGQYGADRVYNVQSDALANFNALAYAELFESIFAKEEAQTAVIPTTANGKYFASLLAGKIDAGYINNAVALPEGDDLTLKTTVFTNKAFAKTGFATEKRIIGLSNNAYGVRENPTSAEVIDFTPDFSEATQKVQVASVDKNKDKVSIADAEIVVSAGRGLKGPENWGMVEELAEVLGAATACSKPVSDMGWRPHSEHVGQTGKPVATNLYIAIGISGAIQHLAGINASKVKVVINNDPEAPFFKAADYGIVGDAFEVVPQLITKLKDFKAKNA